MHCGPTLWNVLPVDLKLCEDFDQFNSLLKTLFLNPCSEWLWYPLIFVQAAAYYVFLPSVIFRVMVMILYFTFTSCSMYMYILCAFMLLLFIFLCLYWCLCKVLVSIWSGHDKEINYYYSFIQTSQRLVGMISMPIVAIPLATYNLRSVNKHWQECHGSVSKIIILFTLYTIYGRSRDRPRDSARRTKSGHDVGHDGGHIVRYIPAATLSGGAATHCDDFI